MAGAGHGCPANGKHSGKTHGRSADTGNTSVLPRSVYQAVLKQDKEELYRLLSKRAVS